MDEEAIKRSAYIMAQAAVLNAQVAGMMAENDLKKINGQPPAFGDGDFEKVINESGCGQNDVISYLYHY